MFNQHKHNKFKNFFDLTELEADFILKNQARYLKINPEKLLNSYKVLFEAVEKSKLEKARIKKYRSKNIYIVKYQHEIVELYTKQGFGYLKISKAMKINHNVKVTKSAIENFVKINELKKGG